MQPDLVSDPGWYGAPLEKEKAEVGWYREFGDTRRREEIPAAEQLWRLKTAKEWITEQFGVVPLEFCAGGNGASRTYTNNTFRIAAQVGFGWAGWNIGYLGHDMVIIGWDFAGSPDAPLVIPAPPNGHDFGITTDPEAFAKVFDQYPDYRFISINEYIGYIHADNSGLWNENEKTLRVTVDYDPHYCRFFQKHTTSWNLQLSDWLQKKMGEISSITVDGKSISVSRPVTVDIPAGTGKHEIKIAF
jgi:hypothetical protein